MDFVGVCRVFHTFSSLMSGQCTLNAQQWICITLHSGIQHKHLQKLCSKLTQFLQYLDKQTPYREIRPEILALNCTKRHNTLWDSWVYDLKDLSNPGYQCVHTLFKWHPRCTPSHRGATVWALHQWCWTQRQVLCFLHFSLHCYYWPLSQQTVAFVFAEKHKCVQLLLILNPHSYFLP